MARQVNKTLTQSSAAHLIERLDAAVAELIEAIAAVEADESNAIALLDESKPEDAKYIADLTTVISLTKRFKTLLGTQSARDEMLDEHTTSVNKLKKEV